MKVCNFHGSRPIGAPHGWEPELDGPVGTIYVMDHVDVQSGIPVKYSVYQPTPEEIAELVAGGAIRFGHVGYGQHPIIQMAVMSAHMTKQCQVRPVWDMGEVLRLEDEPNDG